MLRIRLRRVGKKNESHFQLVVAPRENSVKGSFTAKLGWYNPKTKELVIDKKAVLDWVEKGAKPSNTAAKLLLSQGIKHKNIVYIPDAPGKPKKKAQEKSKPKEKASNSEKAPEVTTEELPPKSEEANKQEKNDDTNKDDTKSDDKDKLENKQDNKQEEAK